MKLRPQQPRAATWPAAIGNHGFATGDPSNQVFNNRFVDIPNAHRVVLHISLQRTGGDGFDELRAGIMLLKPVAESSHA